MNSGCFGREFKDILISVQAINRLGEVLTIPSKDIIFGYRSCNLAKDLIFLSASFKGNKDKKDKIEQEVKNLKANSAKIDGQKITDILTVNGVRFSLEDGSWGLIRASSNKPSLVVVTESTTSNKRKKEIFEFIDSLLKKTGKVGEYDQKI